MTSAAPLTLVFPGLVWLMAALALVQVSRRAALWRVGTAAPVAWLDGLAKLPRRYLVDVHHVVARDAYASSIVSLWNRTRRPNASDAIAAISVMVRDCGPVMS